MCAKNSPAQRTRITALHHLGQPVSLCRTMRRPDPCHASRCLPYCISESVALCFWLTFLERSHSGCHCELPVVADFQIHCDGEGQIEDSSAGTLRRRVGFHCKCYLGFASISGPEAPDCIARVARGTRMVGAKHAADAMLAANTTARSMTPFSD